jgi:protein-serine/threonine kinase
MVSPSFSSSAELRFISSLSPSEQSPRLQSSHTWKSVFRFPNSSNKKLPQATSSLTLDSQIHPASPYGGSHSTPAAPVPSLTPASCTFDQRSSYNSSNTQSSDSNTGIPSRGRHVSSPHRNHSHVPYQHTLLPTEGLAVASTPGRAQPHTKLEKQRITLSKSTGSPRGKDTTGRVLPSSSPHAPALPPSRSRNVIPLSPKAMSASASRFIRRVASAPNAKGLFASNSRSPAMTKNGFLAPGEVIPPVPPLASSSEKGADSLETSSSSSSKGLNGLLAPPVTTPPLPGSDQSISLLESPTKVAFRRTYSSNSIKVRQVIIIVTDLFHYFI